MPNTFQSSFTYTDGLLCETVRRCFVLIDPVSYFRYNKHETGKVTELEVDEEREITAKRPKFTLQDNGITPFKLVIKGWFRSELSYFVCLSGNLYILLRFSFPQNK